jgi:hypothetical protein
MPSETSTTANEPLIDVPPPARQAEERELPLRTARALAVGAWIVVPLVLWSGIIGAVVQIVQRLR